MKIKNIVIVLALCFFSAVNTKNLNTGKPAANVQQGQQQPQVIFTQQQSQQGQQQQIQQPAGGAAPVTPTQADVDALFNELMRASVPWNNALQKRYDNTKEFFSIKQQNDLYNQYQKKLREAELANIQNQGPTLESFKAIAQPQVAQPKEQGFLDKIKAWWSGKNTAENLATVTPWAAVAASAAGVSAIPVVLTGLGAAAATYAVSSALDQLAFIQKTGGYWSNKAYKDRLKEDMALLLNDQGAYPYFITRLEAIKNNNEMYPINKDVNGVAKEVLNDLQNNMIAASQRIGNIQRDRENKFAQERDLIRSQYSYSTLTPEQYVQKIEENSDKLLQAQALVSEYSRALNRINVQREAQKAATQSQQPAPQTPAQAPMGNPANKPAAQ
ncbi:MAG TPA: hypothetical protein VKU36_01255 [Candidatus Babeliales bacterium]|nr:hypothetical protein [Candidatus Babeliales bacterium]